MNVSPCFSCCSLSHFLLVRDPVSPWICFSLYIYSCLSLCLLVSPCLSLSLLASPCLSLSSIFFFPSPFVSFLLPQTATSWAWFPILEGKTVMISSALIPPSRRRSGCFFIGESFFEAFFKGEVWTLLLLVVPWHFCLMVVACWLSI